MSIVSPLRIDAVEVPGTNVLIGMTVCPGKDEYAGLGVPPVRSRPLSRRIMF